MSQVQEFILCLPGNGGYGKDRPAFSKDDDDSSVKKELQEVQSGETR